MAYMCKDDEELQIKAGILVGFFLANHIGKSLHATGGDVNKYILKAAPDFKCTFSLLQQFCKDVCTSRISYKNWVPH